MELMLRAAIGEQTQGTDLWTREGRRERVSCMEKFTIPYAKQTANRNLLYHSGNSIRDSVTI